MLDVFTEESAKVPCSKGARSKRFQSERRCSLLRRYLLTLQRDAARGENLRSAEAVSLALPLAVLRL